MREIGYYYEVRCTLRFLPICFVCWCAPCLEQVNLLATILWLIQTVEPRSDVFLCIFCDCLTRTDKSTCSSTSLQYGLFRVKKLFSSLKNLSSSSEETEKFASFYVFIFLPMFSNVVRKDIANETIVHYVRKVTITKDNVETKITLNNDIK